MTASPYGERTPTVSVGLPVFNAERYLALALDSLLRQTFDDFELIVSDNGSTDATEEICRTYAREDSRLRFERINENRGATWNFNHVFHLARGRYFRWAAYDDLCAPTHLERLVHALQEASPRVVLCYTRTRLIDADGADLGEYEDRLALRDPRPSQRLVRLIRHVGYANAIYGLIRPEALSKTRLVGSYPSADLVLLGELALLGEFCEVPEPLFLRRVHEQMSTRANPTSRQVLMWFDPSQTARNPRVAWRLLGEFTRAIWRAPLPLGARLRAYGAYLPVWLRARNTYLVAEAADVALAVVRWPARAAARLLGGRNASSKAAPPHERSKP
jgi:glycosyltransferase involved in cell wall biosynthesis